MSRIKDLEIRGIRNFGDESQKARIHFSKPLTLVLGPNGTGKTTIIEALKFITSGEYPPDSDRGKSFVHEPKAMSHTVRGQVKAKILDKKGQELVVTRTMQVTRQKNGTLKLQGLDNTITRINEKTNDKIQISSRCADIDREMLVAMGVSKPILNYVIFCHQEESNWPLEDGKKLKERFDDIFDTSKYNKALDATTKLIKDLQSGVNEIKAEENGLKKLVEVVESKESKLREDEKREKEGKEKINEINAAIIPIDERMKTILQIKKEHDNLDDIIKKVETDYKVTNNYVESLKKHIKHVHTGPKEILVQKLETYDQNLTQKVTVKKQYEEELVEIEKREKVLSKKLDDTRIQLGSLKEKKLSFDDKVVKRNDLLTKAMSTWEIPENDDELTEEEIQDCISQINNKYESFVEAMKNNIEMRESEEKFLQEEVDNKRTVKTGIESESNLKDKESKGIVVELKEIRDKIKNAGEAGNKLRGVESNLENATKTYNSLLENFKEDSLKKSLQEEIAKKKELDVKLNQIDREIDSLHQQSAQQTELEYDQSRLDKIDSKIISLKNKHKDDLTLLFDDNEIPQKKIKNSLEEVQRSLTNEKLNLMKKIEEEQKKLTKLETDLTHKKKELKKTMSELEGYREKVYSQCQGGDYNEVLLLQERKVKHLQDQRGIYANQSLMYDEFLKVLKKKSCCPLCERGFQSSSETKKLEQKLSSEIEKSPQCLKDCEKKLKSEQTRYDALQQLKPVNRMIKEIETKLPALKTSVEQLGKDVKNTEESLESLRLVLSEPEEKLIIYKNIIGDVILLDSSIDEQDKLSDTIALKKREMQKAGKIGDRSMQEAKDERQALKTELTKVENNVTKIQTSLQTGQEKVTKAREQKNKLNEEVIQIRQTMQEQKQLQDKYNELLSKRESIASDQRTLKLKLVEAENELACAITELEKLKKKNREEHDKDTNFKTKSYNEINGLETVHQEVLDYVNSKIDEKLKNIKASMEKIKQEYEKEKLEKVTKEEKIRFLDEQCKSQETGKRDLENNLDLIRKQEDLENIKEKLSHNKKLLENLQFDQLKDEYHLLQEEKDQYEKKKNVIKGAQGELENAIKMERKDLNQDKYRMVRKNYKEKQLKHIIQKEAIANLKAYATVLDKAMIQFHEERMNTVNKIMHQLWSLVYGGNDTSSIQIRVQSTEGIGDKRRSYNYKLVQVKRSMEMDMKGRCSAGQKVLASIIIRMALAETFCSDCAVLALDEPTTNLDEENATNLAVTLSKVIQLRAQHHQNFQLIVISHDEKFISHLSNLSGKQIFQELYRNMEGYSLVRRRDMNDFTRNSTQNVTDEKFENDSEEEEEEEEEEAAAQEDNAKNKKRRHLSLDDSPPRVSKKRAFF
ncbi:DNA repair protein RAD50 [Copidosoma floridanum]|uniref:DNA repair protein RAD50 n=1 Tax=Copidosoma floridanum TaxID=29053 RepID=UPI0006C9C50A|nr:DNA repair protein RAD50 [Copidosoma floridanum]